MSSGANPLPKLADNTSTKFLKTLVVGDPGSGKTGALTSLVAAGYKLRIYDFDNLLGSLVQFVKKTCPDKIDNVRFKTFTDKMKGLDAPLTMIGGRAEVMTPTDGVPTAFVSCLKSLNKWVDEGEDLGKPSEWGADTIVVIDSLTSCAQSAYRYAKAMNPMAKEGQTHYFTAQQMVMNLLYLLGSEQFQTNVIVLAHIDYNQNHLGITKGFPRSIGSAINSQIAGVFNSVLLCETTNNKRLVKTESNGIVDLKNPVSFKLAKELPLETGYAEFFKAVKEA